MKKEKDLILFDIAFLSSMILLFIINLLTLFI